LGKPLRANPFTTTDEATRTCRNRPRRSTRTTAPHGRCVAQWPPLMRSTCATQDRERSGVLDTAHRTSGHPTDEEYTSPRVRCRLVVRIGYNHSNPIAAS
jgi:hypothetical protein